MNGSSTLSTSTSSTSESVSSFSIPSSSDVISSSPGPSLLGMRKGQKKLIGTIGFGGSFNWEIPPFPGEKKVCSKIEQIEVKFLSNRGTQVEDRDWALLEVEQNGLAVDLGSEVGSNGRKIDGGDWFEGIKTGEEDIDEKAYAREYSKLKNEQRIDRGTYCDGYAGCFRYEEKVKKLADDFPLADGTHIEEVLNACHGDYQWAFNLLSQFNEEHFTNNAYSSITNQANTLSDDRMTQASSELSSPSSPSSSNSPVTSPVSDNSCQVEKDSDTFTIASQLLLGDLDKQTSQYTFYLDPAFADKLQSSFGQVLKEGEIDEKYLRVDCSGEVAHLIHYLWVKAYNSSTKDKPASDPNTNTNNKPFDLSSLIKPSGTKLTKTSAANNNVSASLSKKESKYNANKTPPFEPKSAFQEIMDLEMAINLSRKEFNSSQYNQANSKQAISTKLKRECLRASYPGLDEKALEELFEANNYSIKETIESIEDTLGIETTITPEVGELIREETGYSDGHSTLNRYSPPTISFNSNDSLEQLRASMDQYMEKRKEFSEKGNAAYQGKMYAVASYYKTQARDLDRKIAELRNQVIEAVITANPSNTLDLHGVHSNEVLTTLGNYLSNKFDEINRRKLNKLRLFIITGRGAHSVNGPRLKPLVINYLKQKRYRHEIINPGVISVTIP